MATNSEKYYYLNRVGLKKGSWALKRFLQDAEKHHIDDLPGKFAAILITEHYELLDGIERTMGKGAAAMLLAAGKGEGAIAAEERSTPHASGKLSVVRPVPAFMQEEEESIELGSVDDELLEDADNQWDM